MSTTTVPSSADARADTWANLPAVTTPLVALTGVLAASGVRPISSASSASQHVSTLPQDTDPNASVARWMRWGAATGGARDTITRRQTVGILAIVASLAICLALAPHVGLILLLGGMTAIYLMDGAYKTLLRLRAERSPQAAFRLARGAGRTDTTDGSDTVPDERDGQGELPLYSVLVPLHREGRILPHLVRRLDQLDYPTNRLEILLLIESDDAETRAALSAFELPRHMRPVIVPAGQPRTKPRALNIGLAHARGEFLVVYDAEDRPEPDQLRKAVGAFRALPRSIICLQARLNFYNIRQSLLARVFAVDYVQWYYMLLPGLVRKRAFVPLGGTSNHFRIRALRRLGGWDPFNVTEDCDLGVRIARAGLEVALLDSTTWEEAVTRVWPWIRQRSRWTKGYFQTYLVHMRHPVRLWREMGMRAFLSFQLLVGGSSLVLLLNPLMWLLTLTYALSSATPLGGVIRSLFPPAIYYPSLLCLVVGNFLFFYSGLYVCLRQGFVRLTRYALLNPVYWVLMSLGAWAGFLDMLRHPHYWAKTEHGVTLPPARSASEPDSAADERVPPERPQLSIVIPASNAAQRLPESLRRLRVYLKERGTSCEVIIVDDGSTDDTCEIVREEMRAWPSVLSFVPSSHRGKRSAIREGVLAARGQYIAFADADLSMAPEELDRFSPVLLGPYDIAIASREAPGGIRLGEPALHRLMSRMFNVLVQLLLLPGIRDTQCGFTVLRREVAQELCGVQTIEGWGFDVELLYIARLWGYSVREVPIVWHYAPGSRVRPLRDGLRLLRDLRTVRSNGASGVYDDDHMPLPLPYLVGTDVGKDAGEEVGERAS